ncbi:succinyldiaminopimelate aminotransferase apoenzyme [Quadrisphaera granulorum]|uniref:Succinyldiaminopimelate aminotransferase n=2 Tax=Quadrisphaera granulorum TaxID=317664 RepID=A0A316ABK3_9ACTN|nr:succinyldiaminopimelate aminotransferase [Quadrisphaera granulorum]SZE95665.1 succinyldiaminopimelate aminotransferase apoenzyme [Quadrisphaera granulorum]
MVTRLVERMRPFTTTVFAEMSALATRTGAVNLGQGFPDTDGPASLLEDAAAALRGGRNQYPPGPGIPELREAVAEHQQRFWGLDVSPADVLVTTGATEAIAAAVMALTGPGDEVVVLEPYYDSYAATVALSGATRRTVPLRAPDFEVTEAALRAAFSDRTRLVLLNSPHNPTGRVLSRAELELVARLAVEHDAVVVSDEVYEHLVFSGAQHVPVASLPGMAERTLVVSSAGKTFSVTGWKIGWVHGPSELVAAVRAVKQFLTYVSGAPFQPAVAAALRLPDEVFTGFAAQLEAKRDLLSQGLAAAGFAVNRCEGTYFVTADVRPLGLTDASALAWRMPEEVGVAAIPVQVFCDDPTAAPTLLRFAFCKRDEVLHAAVERLAAAGPRLAAP